VEKMGLGQWKLFSFGNEKREGLVNLGIKSAHKFLKRKGASFNAPQKKEKKS